jgi:2-oxoglutarate ferredoxin oxidoreductase subunit beta
MLEEAIRRNWLITGLIYVDPNAPNFFDLYQLGDKPLNRMPSSQLRPNKKSLESLNRQFD